MPYMVIEGAIGVGKTTLTRLVGERLGMPVLLEYFEENPFLNGFTQSTPARILYACPSVGCCA
jgi:deoxyadenosine/deoxycytidine kinase